MDKIKSKEIREELKKGTVFNNINEIIVCHDVENNIVWANKAYLRTTDKRLSELRGEKCFTCWGLEAPCEGCPALLAVRTGLPHEAELTPENQPHWPKDRGSWLIRATPILDSNNRIIGAIEVAEDISERKKVELQLKQARDDLEKQVNERTAELQLRTRQLSKLASELALTEQRERKRLAGILHDHLQQILVGAKYAIEALAMDCDPSGDRGFQKVEDLLDEALDTSRSLAMELSPPILHEAGLASGLRWLVRWLEDRCGLETELHIDDTIVCHREDIRILLFQAVRELLFNVSKHAGVNQARLEMEREGDNRLRITVADRGVGFDPADIWSNEEATGYGLLSIRERLSLLGGHIYFKSVPKQGSRFIITAPLESEVPTSSIPGTPAWPGLRTDGYDLEIARTEEESSFIRIMLVDDHHVMRRGLSALLAQKKDMKVVGEAADGSQAVEMARKLLPDVILMDFSMPVMDGVEATRLIRRDLPEVRIIGLSMYDEADRASAMMDAGAMAYVNKSGNPKNLVDLIRRTASQNALGEDKHSSAS